MCDDGWEAVHAQLAETVAGAARLHCADATGRCAACSCACPGVSILNFVIRTGVA
eukprot:COSAG01_NODE_7249_length_3283_cov_3.343593_3_plen_55_part_00